MVNDMKTEQLVQLVADMADLIRFHELEAVDSSAVRCLEKAQEVNQEFSIVDTDLDEYLEQVRQANVHFMT
jgi:hypothetical protein